MRIPRVLSPKRRLGISADVIYLGGHPLQETHCVAARVSEAVPMITGFPIPPWIEDGVPDKKEGYASAVLVSFAVSSQWRNQMRRRQTK